MTEIYPTDATLLALQTDPATGIEYIPTGKTPYYLEHRKLVQRLNLAARLANELRVYQDGDLTIGVRSGRALIEDTVVDFAGDTGLSVTNDATNYVSIDSAGVIGISASAFPTDRSMHIRLAQVAAANGAITSIADLRGEASLQSAEGDDPAPVAVALGGALTATVNGALAGIVPFDGTVMDVILSMGSNLDTSQGADFIRGTAKVNGTVLCSTDPKITVAAGTGFRSTAQGDGTAAVVKSDGTEQVSAGDVLTVDVARSVSGILNADAQNVVVALLIKRQRWA